MDTVTRRRFLELSGVMSTGAFAAACSSSHGHPVGAPKLTPSGPQTSGAQLGAAAQHAPLAPGQGVLVLVTLYGGNDGLNTVIPYADPAYNSSRPDLAYSASQVLDLGEGLGFNPAMTGLHQMWQRKLCAVVRGVGYPQPNHSHFVSMDIWQTATPGDPTNSGWLWPLARRPARRPDAGPESGLRRRHAPAAARGTKTEGSSLPIGQFRLPKPDRWTPASRGWGSRRRRTPPWPRTPPGTSPTCSPSPRPSPRRWPRRPTPREPREPRAPRARREPRPPPPPRPPRAQRWLNSWTSSPVHQGNVPTRV